MAMTRTAWIDDDGTGTTGTVINNAEKTLLYNQIDAEFVKYLPLAGGTMTGEFRVNVIGTFVVKPTPGTVSINGEGDPASRLTIVAGTSFNAINAGCQSAGSISVYAKHDNNSATGYVAYFLNVGAGTGLYLNNSGAWTAISDARLKSDVRPLDVREGLRQITPRDFVWNANNEDRQYGFIAQEVQSVFPNLVTASPDGMLGVTYTGLIAPLVEGWQDHDRRLAQLEQRLSERNG